MRNLPLPIRWILNIIFFLAYYFIIVFISGFIMGFVLMLIGAYTDSVIDVVSEIISLAGLPVTAITIYFRDKFYLLANKSSEKTQDTVLQESVEIEKP